ncbi:MAG TPA: DUF3352 domain-containing protein, partial [Gaiellaceae bacterium]|nr:DUF3352 domain-containing protein [Gaiellaceae bacterium]
MRLIAATLLAALVAAVSAACGGGDGGPGGAADVVPRDVALYAVVDTDFDGGQWDAVEELAAKFPGGANLMQRIVDEVEADGEGDLDFEEDVRPALGPEVVFVVLEFASDSGEDPPFVVMTQPEDEEALRRLLDEGDEPAASREVDGWQVVAEDEAMLDRFDAARDGPALADSDVFAEAMDGLEDEALVSLFLDPETIAGAAGAETETEALDAFYPGGAAPAVGATLTAEDEGARADARLVYSEDVEGAPLASEPYEAELTGRIPGDVLAYVSFNDLEGAFSAVRDMLSESEPELERQLGVAEAFLGVSLEEDVAPLFAGEGALYVRPGALIPEVTLVTEVEDEEQALATLDRIV